MTTPIVILARSGLDAKRGAVSNDATLWLDTVMPVFPNTSGKSWVDVAYSPELNLFCAISSNGGTTFIATTTDGQVWTPRTAPEANTWESICWAPALHLFVAVSSDGTHRVMTSPDGITWTMRTAAEANQWRSVCYSKELNLLVAVADSGTHRVMTSTDGFTWLPQTAGAASSWRWVAWDRVAAVFCAVGITGGHTMTSTDGATWVDNDCSATLSSFGYTRIVADNAGTFMAVGGNSGQVAISTNGGTTWSRTDGLLGGGDAMLGAMYSWTNRLWIACNVNGVVTSPNGLAPWTTQSITAAGWTALAEASYGAWDDFIVITPSLGLAGAAAIRNVPSTDITITWARRNRLNGSPLFVTDDVPMSEATEEYEVDFVQAGQVVRTIAGLTSPSAVYTKQMQQDDGWTLAPVQLTLRIYQISAIVGRGLTQEVNIDVE